MKEIQIDESNQMLSPNQAGNLLGVSGKTMVRWMEQGLFPGYQIGVTYKFRRGDIEMFRESKRIQGKKEDQPKREFVA